MSSRQAPQPGTRLRWRRQLLDCAKRELSFEITSGSIASRHAVAFWRTSHGWLSCPPQQMCSRSRRRTAPRISAGQRSTTTSRAWRALPTTTTAPRTDSGGTQATPMLFSQQPLVSLLATPRRDCTPRIGPRTVRPAKVVPARQVTDPWAGSVVAALRRSIDLPGQRAVQGIHRLELCHARTMHVKAGRRGKCPYGRAWQGTGSRVARSAGSTRASDLARGACSRTFKSLHHEPTGLDSLRTWIGGPWPN